MPRGGKRTGAGRKANRVSSILKKSLGDLNSPISNATIKEIKLGLQLTRKATAAEILAEHNETEKWALLLNSLDEQIVIKAMMYLTDRRDGKAPQTLNVNHSTFDGGARLAELLAGGVTAANQLPAIGRA